MMDMWLFSESKLRTKFDTIFLHIKNIFGTIVIYNIFEEMDMKKISMTMLLVLVLFMGGGIDKLR